MEYTHRPRQVPANQGYRAPGPPPELLLLPVSLHRPPPRINLCAARWLPREVSPMLSSEVKAHVGKVVEVEYTDKSGNVFFQTAELFDIGFLPLYGPCLILDIGEIRLDRVVSCRPIQRRTLKTA